MNININIKRERASDVAIKHDSRAPFPNHGVLVDEKMNLMPYMNTCMGPSLCSWPIRLLDVGVSWSWSWSGVTLHDMFNFTLAHKQAHRFDGLGFRV